MRRQKTSTNTSNSTPTIINAIASGEIFITYPGGGGGFGGPLVVLGLGLGLS